MNGFRKSSLGISQNAAPSSGYDVEVPITREVLQKGAKEPVTVVELKRRPVAEYAKTLALPHSEDYQLRDMLAAGQMPELVNVSGMLDSADPTDPRNIGAGDALFSRLAEMAERPSETPAVEPAVESVVAPAEPVTPVEPSNVE